MTDQGAAPGGTPVILGVSLKQYLDIASSARWARSAARVASGHSAVAEGRVRLFVLPSLPAIPAVRQAIGDAPIAVGAQDLHWADRGAYTGGVSGTDLAALGCTLVEVGHAERRKVFGEDAGTVRRKLAAAMRNGLVPVLCVGETVQSGAADAVGECIRQLESALSGIEDRDGLRELIVAYEPEWAIGAAAAAEPAHVIEVVRALRLRMAQERWLDTRIIYGGSAKRGTLTALSGAVDGLFLGRFAHDAGDYADIIDEASSVA